MKFKIAGSFVVAVVLGWLSLRFRRKISVQDSPK